jgi:hypothetical protein
LLKLLRLWSTCMVNTSFTWTWSLKVRPSELQHLT